MSKPNKHLLLYRSVCATAHCVLRLLYRIRVRGEAPKHSGGLILACNHVSYMDPVILGAIWPTPIHFMARSSLFSPAWFGSLLRRLNTHPIEREGANPRAFQLACQLLEEGHPVILFPEGTRSPDGTLQPLKGGVARLAARTGCPVVPIYLHGVDRVWPRRRRLPHLTGRILCCIGEPLSFESVAHLERHEGYAAFTHKLAEALLRLRNSC